jgi:hypothetical protein
MSMGIDKARQNGRVAKVNIGMTLSPRLHG